MKTKLQATNRNTWPYGVNTWPYYSQCKFGWMDNSKFQLWDISSENVI